MNIQLLASNIELTDAIRAHVQEKLGGLDKYFDHIISARVEVGKTTNHHHKGEVFRAEANLDVPGTVIRAEAVADDLYKAINETKDILKRELMTYKERSRSHQ